MVGGSSPSQKLGRVVVCGGNHVCIHKTQIKNIMGGYKNNYLSAMDFLEENNRQVAGLTVEDSTRIDVEVFPVQTFWRVAC